MKIIAITQARLGSTRLPGKVLKEVDGVSLLELHLKRASRSRLLSKLIVATTLEPEDDRICALAQRLGFSVYRGSVNDVLDRYYQAAKTEEPDYVVRITADCPLIDPEVIDAAIELCLAQHVDYASNTLDPTYPDGIDVEVFKFAALELAWKEAKLPSEREHVTPYIWKNSSAKGGDRFRAASLQNAVDDSDLRITVDEPEDFVVIERLVRQLGPDCRWQDYARRLRQDPDLLRTNYGIMRNEGYAKSLQDDQQLENPPMPSFLATTALEEFWDTSRPMLFLGEWCLLYHRRHVWEPLNATVCEPVWKGAEQAQAAYHDAMAAYERLLPILAEELNRFHQLSHGARYWRIVLGPWLMRYTHALYDRYCSLKALIASGVAFDTILLAEEAFVTPTDTMDYVQRSLSDLYNLQLYSRIMRELGRDFPSKPARPEVSAAPSPKKRTLKNWLLGMVSGDSPIKGRIVLYNSYFSTLDGFKIAFRTRFRVQAVNRNYQAESFASDPARRRAFQPAGETGDAFVDMLCRFMPLDLPACFLEGFAAIERRISDDCRHVPAAILAANPWYFDETFKRWAAFCSEKGTKLYGVQHGGNYGSLKHLYVLEHEKAIADRFFTWGWSGEDERCIPFFASKLVGRQASERNHRATSGILLATTTMPRFLHTFPSTPEDFSEYLRWQIRFYSSLQHKGELRIRPHAVDWGWDIIERLRDNCAAATIETWQASFKDSLKNCRLYVCDHLSTTFIEALASNKPTILFWAPQANELSAEAQPYYAELRDVGILHETPEAAARKIDEVYDSVDSWWSEPSRQAVVKRFCHQFGRTAPDALDQWVGKLNLLLKEGTLGPVSPRRLEKMD